MALAPENLDASISTLAEGLKSWYKTTYGKPFEILHKGSACWRSKKIGQGEYSKVFSDGIYAYKRVKIKDRASLRMACKEAVFLHSLSHPNILQSLETQIVMEHGRIVLIIHKLPLAERTLSPSDNIGPLAHALKALHDDFGVIHGDIKPDNVLIMPDATLKLSDFSISNVLYAKADLALGTEHWQSPEQARGDSCTTKSDVWAFGMIYMWCNGVDREAIQEMLHHEPDKRWTMAKICDVYYPSVKTWQKKPCETKFASKTQWFAIVQDFLWQNKWNDSHEFQSAIYHILTMTNYCLIMPNHLDEFAEQCFQQLAGKGIHDNREE